MIWVFFPIPIVSILLLSFSKPRFLERFGFSIVRRIFFLKLSFGPLKLDTIWFFIFASVVIFAATVQKLHHIECKGSNGEIVSCSNMQPYYMKSMKLRAQRNFWLALFNFFLWIVVWRIFCLKREVLNLKAKLESVITVAETDSKEKSSKKEE